MNILKCFVFLGSPTALSLVALGILSCGVEPDVSVGLPASSSASSGQSKSVAEADPPQEHTVRSGWLNSNTLVRTTRRADGSESRSTFTFEERTTSKSTDHNNDGSIEQRLVTHLDGNGNVLRQEFFRREATTPFRVNHFDENEVRVRQEFFDDNGVATREVAYTYNDDHQLFKEVVKKNLDGVPGFDRRLTYKKDGATGRILRLAIDTNNDGRANELIVYNERGLVELKQFSEDGYGTADKMVSYFYAYGTDKLNYEIRRRDTTGDGFIDLQVRYNYILGGSRLASKKVDLGADGSTDQAMTYDPNGNLVVKRMDKNGRGGLERIVTYLYDAEGRLVMKTKYTDREDVGGDTQLERTGIGAISIEVYDSIGNKVRTITDKENDGRADAITHYLYDHDGNAISERVKFRYNRVEPPEPPEVEFARKVDGPRAVFLYDAEGRLVRIEPKTRSTTLMTLPVQVFFYGYLGASRGGSTQQVPAAPNEDPVLATDQEEPLPPEAEDIEPPIDYSGLPYRDFMALLFTELDTNAIDESIVHQSDFGGTRFYRNAAGDIVKATGEPLNFDEVIYYYRNAAFQKEVSVWTKSEFNDGQLALFSEQENGLEVSIHVHDFNRDNLPDEVVRYYVSLDSDGFFFRYTVDNNVDGVVDEVHNF